MSTKALKRIRVSSGSRVDCVNFVDRDVLDKEQIREMGEELFHLVTPDENGNPPLLGPNPKIVLRFKGVEFFGSAAMNKLILLHRAISKNGGQLGLCEMRPAVEEVFEITRLNKMFDIHDTVEDAMDAM